MRDFWGSIISLLKHTRFDVIALALTAGEEGNHVLVMRRVINAKTAAIVVGDFIKTEQHFLPGIVQANFTPFIEEEEWLAGKNLEAEGLVVTK